MADVKLGPLGSETTLPILRWVGAAQPILPISVRKQIEERRMSDGSIRYGFFLTKHQWILSWGFLANAEIDTFKTLYALNQSLRFQDNNKDATWYNVVFISFDFEPVDSSMRNLDYYKCTIVLRES